MTKTKKLNQALFAALILIAGNDIAIAASNQLAGHPSPYLALHAGDPVNWQSWQAGVFTEARESNRLVLVSVGYFACHWCHVMQRESYQHAETAEFLNRRYLSVKVDRELNPELDRQLISFVQQLRGVAGWPLNVFLTPEGYPLTGFTYLPQDEFLQLLQRLDTEWENNHLVLAASARDYFKSSENALAQRPADTPATTAELVEAFVQQAMGAADVLQGGFGDTRKFPSVPQLDALLDSYSIREDPEIAEFIQLTLQNMATHNLRDHVNDGFFRYTTDPDWYTPHFEKMLYDNALLSSLYLRADQIWPGRGYSTTALRTLDAVEQQLVHPAGGYMSSLSAVDADGREGSAYLWTQSQLRQLLQPVEYEHLKQHWQMDEISGEFLVGRSTAISTQDSTLDQQIRNKLRQRKSMPADDKRLASWNAMMLEALTRASDHEIRYVERAQRQYRAMHQLFFSEGKLIRFAGHPDIAAAVLEDYAYSAAAFLHYGARFDDGDAIDLARQLVEEAHERFLKNGRWQIATDSLLPLDTGHWTIGDRVFYSPVSLWLHTALSLPEIDQGVRNSAQTLLMRVTPEMLEIPFDYGSLILLRARSIQVK